MRSVTRLPSSTLHALRDVVCVALAALVLGAGLAFWIVQTDPTWQQWLRTGLVSASGSAVTMGWDWARSLILPVLATWWAARARARSRTSWLPTATALVLVIIAALVAVLPWPGGTHLTGFWPGPVDPFVETTDGTPTLSPTLAWAYPVLTAATLTCAAALGRRSGKGQHPKAVEPLGPIPSSGWPLTVTVVAIPATIATTGAVVAMLTGSSMLLSDVPLSNLVVALAAAVLLSGTGTSGRVVGSLCAVPVVVGPVQSWLAGGNDLLLVQAAAGAVACLVVAAWRPCVTWAASTLRSAEPPPKTPTQTENLV